MFPWKRVGVMGLGLSGCAAAGFLARHGAQVVAVDARPRGALFDEVAELEKLGVTLKLGSDGSKGSADASAFAGCDVVICSPGVPPGIPPLAGARAARTPIIAEVELAWRFLRGVAIGITGSNGKSTVTALTGEILLAAGIPTRVCGNIGTPLTTVVEADLKLPASEAKKIHYVIELSSFQLEGIEQMAPHIAVLLNLSPDHQDRYARPEDYFDAKARIFMNQRGDDVAVVSWDDALVRPFTERVAARLYPFSITQDLEEGAVLDAGKITLRREGRDQIIMDAAAVPIPGQHNLENVLACCAVAAHCGVSPAVMAKAVGAFKGLPHRLEFVKKISDVSYYNDSKATNVGATLRAMQSFTAPIILLLGGYDKGGDFESLRAPLSEKAGRVKAVVTFGKAGDNIAKRLDGSGRVVASGSLSDATHAAAQLARAGDIVLLSPACASFDAYTGYDKRGEDFRAIVKGLSSQKGGQA